MTPAEYLELETRTPEHEKREFVNGEVYLMAGASFAHVVVAANLIRSFGNALLGGPCRTLTNDMRVQVELTNAYTYPDVVVVCGTPALTGPKPRSLTNPTLLAEVLSPSTASDDRGWKWAHYRRIASLQTYLLVDPLVPHIEVYTRNPDNSWTLTEAAGRTGMIALPGLGVTLDLAAIYDGTEGLGPDGEPIVAAGA